MGRIETKRNGKSKKEKRRDSKTPKSKSFGQQVFLPESIVEEFSQNYPILREKLSSALEAKYVRKFILIAVINVVSKRFRHKIYRDSFSMHCRDLQGGWFKNGWFDKVNGVTGIFKKKGKPWYTKNKKGYCQPWQISQPALDLILKAMRNGVCNSTFVLISGKKRRKPRKNAIVSKNSSGQNKQVQLVMKPVISINRNSLELAIEDYEKLLKNGPHLHISDEKCQRVLTQLRMFQTLANEASPKGHDRIQQYYQESSAGRLYGIGLNLQSVHSEVKHACLKGCVEYDIENCHFVILKKLANDHNIKVAAIDYYIGNKAEVRKIIASKLELSEKQVKTALISILYGARLQVSRFSGITTEFGRSNAEQFFNMDFVKGLYDDIHGVAKAEFATQRKTRQGSLLNCRGFGINKENGRPLSFGKKLSHILQGYESKFLNYVVKNFQKYLVSLEHDGWVLSIMASFGSFEAEFRKQGFELKVAFKRI
jgi:hypothetical protein